MLFVPCSKASKGIRSGYMNEIILKGKRFTRQVIKEGIPKDGKNGMPLIYRSITSLLQQPA